MTEITPAMIRPEKDLDAEYARMAEESGIPEAEVRSMVASKCRTLKRDVETHMLFRHWFDDLENGPTFKMRRTEGTE